MFVKQVSIFLENKKGTIAQCINELGKNDINIRALSVADTQDYGILRLIVNDPQKAYLVLKEASYTAQITDVLGFAIPDVPNGLGSALKILNDNNVDISYIYSFVGHYGDKAVGCIKCPDLEMAKNVLQQNNIDVVSNEDICCN